MPCLGIQTCQCCLYGQHEMQRCRQGRREVRESRPPASQMWVSCCVCPSTAPGPCACAEATHARLLAGLLCVAARDKLT